MKISCDDHTGRGSLCRGLLLVFLCCWLLPGGMAAAEQTISFPAQIVRIADEAFYGDQTITAIELPDGLEEIGERAFAECTGLTEVALPESVTYIGEAAFPESAGLRCAPGSYAENWALEHGYRVIEEEARYFALLIGQTYETTGTLTPLQGCLEDARAVQRMLQTMTGTPYQTTLATGLTAKGILDAVGAAFAEATERDVCMLYYAGHGAYSPGTATNGALIGEDGLALKLSELRAAMDRVPGSKIVVLDSCYSGSMIPRSGGGSPAPVDLASVNASVISAFSMVSRGASGEYYILTAASEKEESFENFDAVNNRWYGIFTYHLLLGSGFNEKSGSTLAFLPADSNDDSAISLLEAYQYSYAGTQSEASAQHVQAYPNNSGFILWQR